MIATASGYMMTKALEYAMAFVMLVVGLTLLQPGETFSAEPYVIVRQYIGEDVGGAIFVLTALARFYGLKKNSEWNRSPLLRLAGCGIGAAFWLTLAVALAGASYPGPPLLPRIAASFVAFEVFSALRTGFDITTLDSLGVRAWIYRRKVKRREQAGA